jgi:hypothetical protein
MPRARASAPDTFAPWRHRLDLARAVKGIAIGALAVAVPVLAYASMWSFAKSAKVGTGGMPTDGPVHTPISFSGTSWRILVAIEVLALGALVLLDASTAWLVLPFVLFFGVWMILGAWAARGHRLPERSGAAANRSRRVALLPVAAVLGISIIARALINN